MKFLILQLKRIGDLILTAPLVAALREHFPDAVIHLAIARSGRVVAEAIPGVDRILETKGNWRETGDWLALMTTGYDYCFDLTRTDRSALLTLLSRATNRTTYRADQVSIEMAADSLQSVYGIVGTLFAHGRSSPCLSAAARDRSCFD